MKITPVGTYVLVKVLYPNDGNEQLEELVIPDEYKAYYSGVAQVLAVGKKVDSREIYPGKHVGFETWAGCRITTNTGAEVCLVKEHKIVLDFKGKPPKRCTVREVAEGISY